MMEKHGSQVCRYTSDPAEGDPDAGINPGTAFTSLTGTWHCPVYESPKEKFTMM
jgi:rubredoxin